MSCDADGSTESRPTKFDTAARDFSRARLCRAKIALEAWKPLPHYFFTRFNRMFWP